MGLIDLIRGSGTTGLVILGITLLSTVLALQKAYELFFVYPYDERFFHSVLALIRNREFDRAFGLCHQAPHPLGRLIAALIRHRGEKKAALEEHTKIELQKLAPRLKKRTHFLQIASVVSAGIGLIGTTNALMLVFSRMGDPTLKSEILARNITTSFSAATLGIVVGLFFHVVWSLISHQQERTLTLYESTTTEAILLLTTNAKETKASA